MLLYVKTYGFLKDLQTSLLISTLCRGSPALKPWAWGQHMACRKWFHEWKDVSLFSFFSFLLCSDSDFLSGGSGSGVFLSRPPTTQAEMSVTHTTPFQWYRGEKGRSQGRRTTLYSILHEWLINIQSPGWLFPSFFFYLSHISDPFTKHTQAARAQWPRLGCLVLLSTDEQLTEWSKHKAVQKSKTKLNSIKFL